MAAYRSLYDMHLCRFGPSGRWWQPTNRFMTMHAAICRMTAEYRISGVSQHSTYKYGTYLYLYTMLSSRSEDSHQMYSRGSVVGEPSLIDPEISPTPPFHFTGGGGQNVQHLALFSTSLDFVPPLFENTARYLNSKTNLLRSDDRPMSSKSLVKSGPCNPDGFLDFTQIWYKVLSGHRRYTTSVQG